MIKSLLQKISQLLFQIIPALGERFSGKIVITIQMREGGVRDLSLETSQKIDLNSEKN